MPDTNHEHAYEPCPSLNIICPSCAHHFDATPQTAKGEINALRAVVAAAVAVSDADLSVYDDVPGSDALMNALDSAVQAWKEGPE